MSQRVSSQRLGFNPKFIDILFFLQEIASSFCMATTADMCTSWMRIIVLFICVITIDRASSTLPFSDLFLSYRRYQVDYLRRIAEYSIAISVTECGFKIIV